ncbi:MAG: 2-hydroxyhepta-2,4-diene-1,7-dioate isomerase, partial [Cyclobacteriaceae bacterium]|nr:2-hydroxyhepta-2,4-diene-1,7-dioate isomerase [Cyclobacteriaceae bacterium]
MKIYKVKSGILIEVDANFYLIENQTWDQFINDDNLCNKANNEIEKLSPLKNADELIHNEIEAPIQSQEVWASGVTYYNSKLGRQEESKDAGGGSFYAHVYEAERPELFFKSTPHRVVGHGVKVRIRKDS